MMVRQPPTCQVFLGSFVQCASRQELEYTHNAAIGVDVQGKIVAVARYSEDVLAAKTRLLDTLGWSESEVNVYTGKPGQFFVPGFIDAHVHASQYPNVGLFGKTTLLDWLETYTFPLEASLEDARKAESVYKTCVSRTLAHGTTTAAYYATIDVATTSLLAEICLAAGQRAFVGRVCMDNPAMCPDYYIDESAEIGLEKTRESIAAIQKMDPKGEMVAPIITPRFAPTCSSASLSGLAAIQRDTDLLLQTHISENENEVALVAKLFPSATSYADVYEQHGLLTPQTILAHAVHLTDAEAELIAARGAKVAHCPCSNSALTSGAARVRWLWGKGVEVGLGTDMSGGYSPSVLEAARQASLVSRHVAMGSCGEGEKRDGERLTVEEVLYLATRGGARCVGLEDKIGGFEVGMDWDAQLIGLRGVGESPETEFEDGNVDIFGWESWEERIAKWVFNGDDRNTKAVWVRGRLVHARKS